MTKGDRDKMRAEIAGQALNGILSGFWGDETMSMHCDARAKKEGHATGYSFAAAHAVSYADALMDRLGLSEASEQAEIQREAERRRGGVS